MQQNVVLRIHSKIHAIFVLLDSQHCLIVIDFVDFEDVEELVPHFDELILGGIVGGKPGDGGHGREEFVGLFYSFDVVDICFADFSFLFGIDY